MPVVDRALKKATDARYWASRTPEWRARRAERRRLAKAPAVEARRRARLLARQQRDIERAAEVRASLEARRCVRLATSSKQVRAPAPLPAADPLMALFGGRAVSEDLS